jgi:parallel beta-helix repeat protein
VNILNSNGVQVLDNEVDIDGCMTPDPSRKNTCGVGGGIALDNSQTPSLGNHLVRGNHVQRAEFEAITLINSPYNSIIGNRIDNSQLGIMLRPSTGTILRNNILIGVGGPSYFNPPGNDATRCGQGIILHMGSTGNTVIGTVITDMTNGSACGSAYNHGIQVWKDGQSGNRILANTITWSVRPIANTAGIWNGGSWSLIDFNVVKNAPIGILNDVSRTAEVKQNNLANNGQHILNSGTLSPYSCNRFNGALQGGCSLPGILIGNSTSLSFLTGADCTGNEHVRSATPYTWNSTGSRGTTQVTNFFASYIDPGGFCHPYGGSLSGMFPVGR